MEALVQHFVETGSLVGVQSYRDGFDPPNV